MNSSSKRITSQRRIILEELRQSRNHPTADEVYQAVRRRLPRISLGTVYRNLELLSQSGELVKIESAGGQRRFDGQDGFHHHVHCTVCGRVEDLYLQPDPALEEKVQSLSGYDVRGQRVEFRGVCPSCRESGQEKKG
jgi:Fur family ferric uptake transcriptional regulator